MSAYYNEIEPFCAQWLRNLIAKNLIAPGEVDERDIRDVKPDDLRGFKQCHFFAGIGGWSYALRLAGWSDDREVWTGSCPCQPFSNAGKRLGFKDDRHLWPVWFDLIRLREPSILFGEQVASLAGLSWFKVVQADLENSRYRSGALDLCAAGVGAPHGRQRLYWMADAYRSGRHRLPKSNQQAPERQQASRWSDPDRCGSASWARAIPVEGADSTRRVCPPGIELLADGLSEGMGRLRAYGNAIVPQVAAAFISAAMECIP